MKSVTASPALRFVNADGLHLTLHFLGELDGAQIEAVTALLEQTANRYSPAELTLTDISAFPNLKQPRVITIQAHQISGLPLINLQQTLGRELSAIGITVDRRPWTPHLTVARVNDRVNVRIGALRVPGLTIPVKSIELMASTLTPRGAEYRVMSSYLLKFY